MMGMKEVAEQRWLCVAGAHQVCVKGVVGTEVQYGVAVLLPGWRMSDI